MPRKLRSLSSEGRLLLNIGLEGSDQKPVSVSKTVKVGLKSKIKSCLNFLFTSSDDDLIESIVSNCRLASTELMSNIFSLNDLPKLIDRFIINIILLILKSPRDSKKVAKYHEAKKQYKLYLNVATTSFKNGDHNTAWLINESLNHFAISSLQIPLNSKRFGTGIKSKRDLKDFFSVAKKEYGSFNSCFRKHIEKVPHVPNNDFIPIVPVLHMYSKRTNEHLKATKTLGMAQEETRKYKENKKNIEDLIEIYSNHFKSTEEGCIFAKEVSLGLYKNPVSLPLNVVKNPLLNVKKTKRVLRSDVQLGCANFADLCFLSKEVLKSKQSMKALKQKNGKIAKLKKTKCLKSQCGSGWRSINAYRLALNRKRSKLGR